MSWHGPWSLGQFFGFFTYEIMDKIFQTGYPDDTGSTQLTHALLVLGLNK
jgi:hypothetical protein